VSEIARLQAFLRATAEARREAVRVGPFTAYFDPADDMKYLNYAIPDDDADPDRASIEDLREAFRARERLPRLELIAEAAPATAPALLAAGMSEELATPLMACAPGELVTTTADVAIAPVGSPAALAVRNLQRIAFGQEPVEEAPTPDGRAVMGTIDGAPVAAAAWTPVIEGASEIVGVATAAPYRRRGFAGALTAAAAQGAFDDGAALCVLSPGDEGAQRVYARAGFRRVATMLHLSDRA
jgi:ribosomal protein S18 acetylase RimI-like enzyme